MTAQQAIDSASSKITKRDAELLLLHTTSRDRAWLLAHPEAELDRAVLASFFENVSRRASHWPLQYITGRQEFFALDLKVTPDVLIPRPETELLVEAVLDWVAEQAGGTGTNDQVQIIDVGTGSGAIAIALASRLPDSKIAAVDLSPRVRSVVDSNAKDLDVGDQVRFVESDLLNAFAAEIRSGKRFDVVVSNPPYVPIGDAASMQPEVRDFEPHMALFAGEDGLQVYRRLIPQAWSALRPGGLLALEFGCGQRDSLAHLLADWDTVRFQDDYAGIPRIALAHRP